MERIKWLKLGGKEITKPPFQPPKFPYLFQPNLTLGGQKKSISQKNIWSKNSVEKTFSQLSAPFAP